MGADIDLDPASQLPKPRRPKRVPLPENLRGTASPEVLNRLWDIIESRRDADPEVSHSARLMSRGPERVAQKFGEEAIECLIEAIAGDRPGIIGESADVLYHLLVIWVATDVRPEEVWRELQERERVSRMTEEENVPLKRLLGSVRIGTTKIP